jgi:hypothetical protein
MDCPVELSSTIETIEATYVEDSASSVETHLERLQFVLRSIVGQQSLQYQKPPLKSLQRGSPFMVDWERLCRPHIIIFIHNHLDPIYDKIVLDRTIGA